MSNQSSNHRRSLSTGVPPQSPRQLRHLSVSHAAQDLLNNPPLPHQTGSVFAGRDWKTISVAEVTDPTLVHWAELDTNVEDATNLLVTSGSPNVILVRENKSSQVCVSTFDYSDLNSYLLLVVGIAWPGDVPDQKYNDIQRRAREGQPVHLGEIQGISGREQFIMISDQAPLTKAVEIFGSGIHRLMIVKEGSQDIVGVLSQLRLVKFFWEHGRHFPAIDKAFPNSIRDLSTGTRSVVSINGDRPVREALELMNREKITSLPVLDNQHNVVGNISHVDVRLLTKSTSLPLLSSSCIHFISVILSERGMDDGKDSYPVFYVSPYSTLAHTVAKLVATISHRMWIVDAPSPSSSNPPTPSPASTHFQPAALHAPPTTSGPPYTPSAGSASAASLPGQHMSGRLSGVVSLTDVLNIIARASGLKPQNPEEARRRRRRSSSSSVRASIDSARSSSVDLNRSTSSIITGSKR